MQLKFEKHTIKHVKGREGRYEIFEIDAETYVDFDIKRVYYLTDLKGDTGEHCHFVEKELFVMAEGSCIAIIDQGHGKEDVKLEKGEAVYVGNYVWHGFKNFAPNSTLMAVSSTKHNPDRSDYLEDYEIYQQKLQDLGAVNKKTA